MLLHWLALALTVVAVLAGLATAMMVFSGWRERQYRRSDDGSRVQNPGGTVAKTLNWMASNNGFYFASVRDFLMSRGVEICVYETAERLIAKSKA